MYELRLIDKCINNNTYEMYQDIPKHSVDYDNSLFGEAYLLKNGEIKKINDNNEIKVI